MNVRRTILIGAILCAIYALSLLGLLAAAHSATTTHYRRPYAVLIGIRPHDVESWKCHNRNLKLPRIYLFGGCKEIGKG